MSPHDRMTKIDELLSHVWMVRTFLKHSEEADEIEELRDVHRELYDYMLALGEPWKNQDAAAYLKLAHKKYAKLKRVTDKFVAEQPEVSTHTNFEMAARSLAVAVREIGELLHGTMRNAE
jgi:cob(I)alamin adenosyltransferase